MTVEEKRKGALNDLNEALKILDIANAIANELKTQTHKNTKGKVGENFPILSSLQDAGNKTGDINFPLVKTNVDMFLRTANSIQNALLDCQTKLISASKQEEKEENLKDKIKE